MPRSPQPGTPAAVRYLASRTRLGVKFGLETVRALLARLGHPEDIRPAPVACFQAGSLTFGIAICHEGWRYPETVRWAARKGAHIVFHPHFHEAEPGSYRPTRFADPANSFPEKAALCRPPRTPVSSPV